MPTRLKTWIIVKPWIIGILLSIAAMFLSWDLGRDAATLLRGEPGIWARLGKGFVIGGVIACLQWPIVRAAGIPPVRFIVAGAISFSVGYPFGQTIQAVLISAGLYWIWWGYGSALAIFGLFLGIPQWWMFRRHMQRASLWILFSVAGWMLTGWAWIAFGVNSFLDSVMYGIVTGPGLVWLVLYQKPRRE